MNNSHRVEVARSKFALDIIFCNRKCYSQFTNEETEVKRDIEKRSKQDVATPRIRGKRERRVKDEHAINYLKSWFGD